MVINISMSKAITYKFTSTPAITGGCEQKFYIPGNSDGTVPNFADLAIKTVTVDQVVMPVEFHNVVDESNLAMMQVGENLVTYTGFPNADSFVNYLNLNFGQDGTAELSSKVVDGVTAYRLTINYTNGLTIDHRLHPAAKFLGFEEVNFAGEGSYTFRIPLDETVFDALLGTNKFHIVIGQVDGPPIDCIYYIPPGNYTADELATQVIMGFQAAEESPHVLTDFNLIFDSTTNKFNFTASTVVPEYESNTYGITFKANKLFGFYEDTFGEFYPGFAINLNINSPYPVDLKRTANVHIKSKQLSKFSVNRKILFPDDKTIIASVPVDKNYTEILVATPKSKLIYGNPVSLPYLDFSLVDDSNRSLNLNGYYWSITITFTYANSIPM